ncbi:hypothetical protein GF337_18485, partial [candidate division KSB1 bacterium]|nr:hypothetical protein [candidate division KSB1 bacterium]
MYLHETLRYFKTILLVIILIFTSVYMASAFPADTIKVNARNGEAGGKSIYELYFSVSQQITPNATITVKFPEGFDLSDVAIASSTTINGGFQVAVSNLS